MMHAMSTPPAQPDPPLARYVDLDGAAEELRRNARATGATEFACVRNLGYVFAPTEVYPLAPRVEPPLDHVVAFLVDMDGTSTTTEPLALHALEYTVRRFTGLTSRGQWSGLDPVRDHPHIVGNSNYRHVEFLVERYHDRLDPDALRRAFFEALCWTLAVMDDPSRRREVRRHAEHCGLGPLLADVAFQRLLASGTVHDENVGELVSPWLRRFGGAFRTEHIRQQVAAALDVYYMRYHSILRRIETGGGRELAKRLLGTQDRGLIEPMPGYEVFLPLAKGWLGDEAAGLAELLEAQRRAAPGGGDAARGPADDPAERLVSLARRFQRRPARLALVTASVPYEARVSMKEVIAVTARRVMGWPLAAEHRERIGARLADVRNVFDAFVSAGDACEHRLKPHRDLYSLALEEMSIPRGQYPSCVGLEDSEPGIIALRAAGIGCAVALPNHDTLRQNYTAATRIVHGGLPELILDHNLLCAP